MPMRNQWKVKKVSEEMSNAMKMCGFRFIIFLLHLELDDREQMIYSPLTCELCSETFTVPAEWVRHIESHAESTHCHVPKKRKRLDISVSFVNWISNIQKFKNEL